MTYRYDSREDYPAAWGMTREEYDQARASYDSAGTGHHPQLTEPTQYHGLDMERLYVVADIIQQQVLESMPVGTWWTIGAIVKSGKGQFDRIEAVTTLTWMVEHQYILSNGRGGCWVNYARKS